MRRTLLPTILLLLIPSFFSATAALQQPEEPLPTPANYPEAGANCKRRVKLSPWVGTPAVEWPKTYQCVLAIHTCDGVKTYKSGVRPGGTGMCDDYWRVHDALSNRETCCDQGSPEERQRPEERRPPEEKQPPEERRSPKGECEPPAPWFDATSGCRELKSPQLVISGGAATLSMCGYRVFYYRDSSLDDPLYADAYRAALRDQLRATSSSKVCCDKFRQAVRTGKPCDPRADVDCDGRPNKTDLDDSKMPGIDAFRRPDIAAIDPLPYLFDTSNPDFLPTRTALNSKGVGDCPCKWELVRGELKCSPDGKQDHYYKATWRCPKTGAEVFTMKYAPATVTCEQ